jgi:hypothetical protein
MCTLPSTWLNVIVCCVPVFSKRVGRYAPVLWLGAMLAPGKRIVTVAVRAMG